MPGANITAGAVRLESQRGRPVQVCRHPTKSMLRGILMSNERYYPGLEGVIAGETAVSTVDGGLLYRGYAVEDLARESSFLEVAYLLLYGELPLQEELADFQSILAESDEVDPSILEFLSHIPLNVPAMDVL